MKALAASGMAHNRALLKFPRFAHDTALPPAIATPASGNLSANLIVRLLYMR
jgi:hypothetical protein